MNFGQNSNNDPAWSYVAAPAVMASPDTLHGTIEKSPGWHSPQQQVAFSKHLGALLKMDPNRSPFTPVGAELPGYPSPSPGQIYMPVSPTNIALPLSAPTSPYTAFGPQLPAYLTPNATAAPSPSLVAANDSKEETIVSVATTFYPGNPDIFPGPNMILASDEGTLFYLNTQVLAVAGFKLPATPPMHGLPMANMTSLPQSPFLPQGSVNKLPDSSVTLSIIFHTIYNISCAPFSPSLDALSHAISRMAEYAISPVSLIQPGTSLYMYLMAQYAPLQALPLYTLAAKHSLEHLAVDVSSHLLGLNLAEITDDVAAAMGSVYLKRLFFMHKGRIERLKNVIAKPPVLHQDVTNECDTAKQSALRRKWALLITSLAWDARPDISPHAIKQHLRLTGDNIPCKRCRGSWMERVVEAATEWATVKFTI